MIYPSDSRIVFTIDYLNNENVFISNALNEKLRIKVYVDDKEVKIFERLMSDLVNKS